MERLVSELPGLRAEQAELSRQLVETREAVILQEVGIYQYRHPLENALAYKARLSGLQARIKDAVKAGNAVRGAANWTVNGSAREGTIIGGECVAVKEPARYRADPWCPLIDCSTAQTPSAGSPATAGPTAAGSAADLVEADEGNQIPMTSLEGVPHHAVMLADLGIQLPLGSCWLPLLAPANGTPMAR